ncbi:cholesterol esterase [Kickxella alabastrina]|nr:cholesterol esterase [Kickxella alabastrina]
MPYIPFFSRLSLTEYQGMIIAALFFIVEKLLRVFLLLFPVGAIVSIMPEWLLLRLRIPQLAGTSKEAERELLDDFNSFAEIMDFWSYPHEDYLVETHDGFILGTHRITGPRKLASAQNQETTPEHTTNTTNTAAATATASESHKRRPVVLFWHGFMLSSECFVCHPDWINILPFRLAEAGYDVWLGNSRGNKYSYKHMKYVPGDERFWNFSIDEIANIDVPATIDYILNETGASSLTYIGFSQGTTQMFMSLSRNKQLNQKVEHFIALAPASTPRGFHNSIVDYFIKATPHMLYLLFGRRRAMSLVYFWINLLPRDLYVSALDFCVGLLFGWKMRNMSQETKCIAYWHLYSYTSVKAIVHWMQIIRCGQLQMYDEDPPVYPSIWSKSPSADADAAAIQVYGRHAEDRHAVPKAGRRRQGQSSGALTHWNNTYPLKNITTRVSLFHGGADSLSSVDALLEELNVSLNESLCFSHYEHMDFLWADSVGTLVIPKVLAILGVHESASIPSPAAQLVFTCTDSKIPNPFVAESRVGSASSGSACDNAGGVSDCEALPSLESSFKKSTVVSPFPLHTRTMNTLSRRRIVLMPGESSSTAPK